MLDERKEKKPKQETWLSRFIEKIASANEKKFGGQVPDCCGGVKAPTGEKKP